MVSRTSKVLCGFPSIVVGTRVEVAVALKNKTPARFDRGVPRRENYVSMIFGVMKKISS
jgi:hypothetical protein